MKKIVTIVLLGFSFIGLSISVSAGEVDSSINNNLSAFTMAEKESVDTYIDQHLDSILAIAKDSGNIAQGQATLNSDDGTIYNLPTYIVDTTELARYLTNNETIRSQVAIVDSSDADVSTLAAGNKGSSMWDKSSSVLANSTIYYDQTTSGAITKYKLTSVKGGYSIKQSGVSVSNQKVTYGCSDSVIGTQRGVKSPKGASFSYSTGFTKYATRQNIGFSCGVTHSMTVKRGSSWSFTHNNNV